MCELTQTHLQQIINPEEKASAPESATVPVPAPTPAADAGIREPIPNQATVGSAASLDRDTDMQSRLSAEDKESERKQNLAREERKKRILEKASRVQVFATFHQSSSLSANSASQEVSRNPTKLAPAKAAPVSTPRAPGPVLDLSKKPRKKIVPEYVDVAGNEFFFYQTVPPQDVTRDRNSRDPERTLPPPRDSPVLNLSKKPRQKIVLEFVKVTGNEFFFYQPVSQQDMTRGRNSRDSETNSSAAKGCRKTRHSKRERYEDRSKENGRCNGNYGQLGESSQGKRYPCDRSPDRGCSDYSRDRRHDVQAMYVDHRRSLDRYDPRPRSPGRLDHAHEVPIDTRGSLEVLVDTFDAHEVPVNMIDGLEVLGDSIDAHEVPIDMIDGLEALAELQGTTETAVGPKHLVIHMFCQRTMKESLQTMAESENTKSGNLHFVSQRAVVTAIMEQMKWVTPKGNKQVCSLRLLRQQLYIRCRYLYHHHNRLF